MYYEEMMKKLIKRKGSKGCDWRAAGIIDANAQFVNNEEVAEREWEQQLTTILKTGDTAKISAFLKSAGDARVRRWQASGLTAKLQSATSTGIPQPLGSPGSSPDALSTIQGMSAVLDSVGSTNEWHKFDKLRSKGDYAKNSLLNFKAASRMSSHLVW